MGMCRCIKCDRFFDSKDDAGDTLYLGYKGDSWACYACHEKEHEKDDAPDNKFVNAKTAERNGPV